MGLVVNNYPFEAVTRTLLKSENKLEREHFLLGFHAEYNYSAPVRRLLLSESMLGRTGNGKTFRLLKRLEPGLMPARDGAVIVIDLKGDRSHCESVRLEAKRTGRTFKYFTNVLGL